MTNPQKKDAAIEPAAADSDPFANLESLRLDQSFVELTSVKKLLTTVWVRKPSAQDFVRVHPDAAYREAYSSN